MTVSTPLRQSDNQKALPLLNTRALRFFWAVCLGVAAMQKAALPKEVASEAFGGFSLGFTS